MPVELCGFTRDFIEAGLKLSERDLLRERFIMSNAKPSWAGGRMTAADNFLAEVLADPEKAASCRPFFPRLLGLEPKPEPAAEPPVIFPWSDQLGMDRHEPPSAATADTEGVEALLDFQGRTAALMAGAALAGAAPLTESLIYTRAIDGRPIRLTDGDRFEFDGADIRIPARADRVLVLGFVRAPEIMGMNPGLSRLRPATGWLTWPEQIAAVLGLAERISAEGWLALPSAGGLLMADHHAVLAGLGELGRQGLLITPEYGPNPRLFTITTDYPFAIGGPLTFGVADYCETCQRCINECPAKALAEGRRRPGLYQWPVDRRACFDNWLQKGDPCRKCIEVCPYTREPLVGSPGGAHRPPT